MGEMATSYRGRVRSFGATDVGLVRSVNQDAYLRDDLLQLYVVADGMGGHAAGEVASQEAVDTVHGMIKRGVATMGSRLSGGITESSAKAACRLMEAAVQAATYMVFAMAELDKDMSGMGTTMSALLVLDDHAVIGQVGDSRVYQIREDRAQQLTEDHTLVGWQVKQGLITPEQAKHSPYRNIVTRAVGNQDFVQVDTGLIELKSGDRFLLCSDGLHGYLRPSEIPLFCAGEGSAVVESLIRVANGRGGKDNITAVLVEVL
jgi:protein phosphatase